jgi:hypothetical protein
MSRQTNPKSYNLAKLPVNRLGNTSGGNVSANDSNVAFSCQSTDSRTVITRVSYVPKFAGRPAAGERPMPRPARRRGRGGAAAAPLPTRLRGGAGAAAPESVALAADAAGSGGIERLK